MEGIANRKEKVLKIAHALDEMKGIDTIALDLSKQNIWTDYFIITTVNSSAHLRGMYKNIKDVLDELCVEILYGQKKIENDDWVLIDCGYFVIHFMNRELREFYELEKLWFNSDILFQALKSS